MKVLRAEHLGYCFGVQDAMELAQRAAQERRGVYALGPLIHNHQAIERLAQAGVRTVERPEQVEGGTVIIRAHGVTPEVMAAARRHSDEVVDATCVLVRRAQEAVRQLHEEGYTVVILGDADHPEVRAMVGFAPAVRVVGESGQLEQVPLNVRLGIVGQTTLSQERFAALLGQIAARPFREMRIINTLCHEVDRRIEAAIALCGRVDVMFVLGGPHSANTRELVHVCRERGVPTHHLADWAAFRPEYVRGCRVAGVTAGASTPDFVIREFIQNLERVDPQAGEAARTPDTARSGRADEHA